MNAICPAVVKRFVAALAGVKVNKVSPAAEVSKVTSDQPLDSITEPVAYASEPAQSKDKVAVPPVVSLD